jgi:hypothetical protein
MNPAQPIIVDIREPDLGPIAGLADVLIGALGLTGVVVLFAVIAGAVLAGILFWMRSGSPLRRSSRMLE